MEHLIKAQAKGRQKQYRKLRFSSY